MKVRVMLVLSVEPAIDTDLELFFAKLCLPIGIYLKGVWSRLRVRQDDTLCSSAIVTMSWRYTSWASFLAPSGISTFPVVNIRFTKPIRLKKLLVHEDESKSVCPRLYSGYLAISALAVAMAMADEISSPFLLVPNKYRGTISSSEPSKRDRPWGRHFKAFLISRFSLEACSSSFL